MLSPNKDISAARTSVRHENYEEEREKELDLTDNRFIQDMQTL